ncbi:hypothetical protein [Streptomyces sp. NPDC006285]
MRGRCFASGAIDEDECRRRLSVLDERFGTESADERFGHPGGSGAA